MKKQLLKENEIRKMMKFANIGALTDGFVEKINETFEMEEDLDEQDELPDEEMEAGAADDMPADEPMDDMPDDEPMDDMEMGGAPEEGGDILSLVKDAMENFIEALKLAGPEGQEAAENLSVQSDDAGDDDVADAGDDMGDDMAMADAGGEMGDEEPALAEMVDEEVNEEEIMNEVARRVARRLRRRG